MSTVIIIIIIKTWHDYATLHGIHQLNKVTIKIYNMSTTRRKQLSRLLTKWVIASFIQVNRQFGALKPSVDFIGQSNNGIRLLLNLAELFIPI